jgi:hypothetical protein
VRQAQRGHTQQDRARNVVPDSSSSSISSNSTSHARRRLVWFKQWGSSSSKIIRKTGKAEANTKASSGKSHAASPPAGARTKPQGIRKANYDRAPYVAVHLRRADPTNELLGCEFGVPSVECGKEGRQWTVSTEQVARAVRMAVDRVNATGVYIASQTYPAVHPKCVCPGVRLPHHRSFVGAMRAVSAHKRF